MNEPLHTDRSSGPRPMPPELEAALAREPADERTALAEVWDLSERYRTTEPDDAVFAAIGAEIWRSLDAAIQTEVRPATPAPLRLVSSPSRSPLRLVSPAVYRWVAVAACIVLLVGVGLYLQRPLSVTAPYGQRTEVDLPDGSHVALNSGSTLTYSRHFGTGDRAVHLEGEAFFSVTRDERPFRVTTFNGTTTVLGTRFNVRARSDDALPATEVAVASGRVRVAARSDDDTFVILGAGEAARLADHTVARLPGVDDTTAAGSWREGSFKFADAPLETVVDEIERRFDVRIDVLDQELLDDPVAIFLENPLAAEAILRDICEYNAYSYRETPGGFEIYQAP